MSAKAGSGATSLYVYLTPRRHPLNDPHMLNNLGLAGWWGGFGVSRGRPGSAYGVVFPGGATPVAVPAGEARTAAAPRGGGGLAQIARRGWRVVVGCGSTGADLELAEMLAASLPPVPAGFSAPGVSVCNAGDGEHTQVSARYRDVWAEASSDHSALSSAMPGRTDRNRKGVSFVCEAVGGAHARRPPPTAVPARYRRPRAAGAR